MINKLVLLGLFFQIGCGAKIENSNYPPIELKLLDVFVCLPNINADTDSVCGSIEHIEFIFGIKNNTKENRYLLFDNWLKDSVEVIKFAIREECENNIDSSELYLAYRASPRLLLPANGADTLAFKTDFRDIRHFVKNCIGNYPTELVKQKLSNFLVIYENKKVLEKIVTKNGIFYPTDDFYVNISKIKGE